MKETNVKCTIQKRSKYSSRNRSVKALFDLAIIYHEFMLLTYIEDAFGAFPGGEKMENNVEAEQDI